LTEAGIRRDYAPRCRAERQAEVTAGDADYGYTQAHRERAGAQRYPSSLTDAEWALVADLFDSEDRRGKPPAYPRRLLVDAGCYVVRTSCSWRMLPADFPPWQNVYRMFRRWMDQGKFEAMNDRLRAQWRARLGRRLPRAPRSSMLNPTAARPRW
jgi:transposase